MVLRDTYHKPIQRDIHQKLILKKLNLKKKFKNLKKIIYNLYQNNNIDVDESIEYNKNQIVMRKRLQYMSYFDGLSDHSAPDEDSPTHAGVLVFWASGLSYKNSPQEVTRKASNGDR